MLKTISRPWLSAGWLAVPALVVAVSRSLEATLSTTVLLAAIGVAPGVVIALLKRGEASPTVAEILHAVHVKEGRP